MPTSPVGFVIFLALIAPGVCYRWRRSVRQPIQKVSELRELASVVLVSVASITATLTAFGVWRSLRPRWALDVGRLIRDGSAYTEKAYVPIFGWAVGLLMVACAIALALAHVADTAAKENSWSNVMARWLRGSREDDVTSEPAWWCMFANHPDEYVYAGCELDDGNYIGGYVYTFSAESDETADRELVLTEPEIRGADGEMASMDVSAVVISARHLQFVSVTYVSDGAEA